ncbi:hypothetical protein Q9L58_010421 [Maublancomyces gigas]|uniref:Uncharacterized protein n=1 Tax=Discina gigas TaxID=1032678 RepID=A0ABR3G468_9PEZI
MRLLLSSFCTAALAIVASAAPTVVAPEVTTDLPARFAMYLVTDEARANGLRIRYVNSNLHINLNDSPQWPSVDGFFLGGRGRIALDRTVHKRPNSNSPTNPEPWGDWNVMFFSGVSQVVVNPEETQALFESWGPGYHPTVGKWVQDSKNVLRLINDDGVLQPNGLRLCGVGASGYSFWWDDVPYLNCPVAEFRIVPL